ncbi:MAG: hypothetical protein RL404_1834 [Pseudomonadota bacterium]
MAEAVAPYQTMQVGTRLHVAPPRDAGAVKACDIPDPRLSGELEPIAA